MEADLGELCKVRCGGSEVRCQCFGSGSMFDQLSFWTTRCLACEENLDSAEAAWSWTQQAPSLTRDGSMEHVLGTEMRNQISINQSEMSQYMLLGVPGLSSAHVCVFWTFV